MAISAQSMLAQVSWHSGHAACRMRKTEGGGGHGSLRPQPRLPARGRATLPIGATRAASERLGACTRRRVRHQRCGIVFATCSSRCATCSTASRLSWVRRLVRPPTTVAIPIRRPMIRWVGCSRSRRALRSDPITIYAFRGRWLRPSPLFLCAIRPASSDAERSQNQWFARRFCMLAAAPEDTQANTSQLFKTDINIVANCIDGMTPPNLCNRYLCAM